MKGKPLEIDTVGAIFKDETFKRHLKPEKSASARMNPKVLETWINETL
jgi:hypothetical protein